MLSRFYFTTNKLLVIPWCYVCCSPDRMTLTIFTRFNPPPKRQNRRDYISCSKWQKTNLTAMRSCPIQWLTLLWMRDTSVLYRVLYISTGMLFSASFVVYWHSICIYLLQRTSNRYGQCLRRSVRKIRLTPVTD